VGCRGFAGAWSEKGPTTAFARSAGVRRTRLLNVEYGGRLSVSESRFQVFGGADGSFVADRNLPRGRPCSARKRASPARRPFTSIAPPTPGRARAGSKLGRRAARATLAGHAITFSRGGRSQGNWAFDFRALQVLGAHKGPFSLAWPGCSVRKAVS